MKLLKSLIFLIFLFFLTFCLYAEYAFVDYVIDGDTVVLDNGEHVRLIGVDTPEIKSDYNYRADFYADEAKAFTKKELQGKRVFLRAEEMQSEKDKYNRRLAYIFLEDGTFFNRELVRLGYAEAIRYFPYKYKKEFMMLEKFAKEKNLGMWKKRRVKNEKFKG